MLEETLKELVAALREHTAAITANTAKMTELTGTPANVVPITKPAPAPKEKAKPAAKETPAPEKEVVEETPAVETPEAPAVEETPEPVEESPAAANDDYLSWDDATLKLAIQEHAKTRLVAPNSAPFKEAFGTELARLGITKAAQLTAEQRPEFYGKMIQWK